MTEGNLEVVRRWFEGLNLHGMPPLELCDPEIEIINPPQFPVRGTYRGHEGVREWLTGAFDIIDELELTAEKVMEAGDDATIVVLLRLRGLASHTRIPIDEPWAAVLTMRNARLLRAQGYVSRREAMRAAGLRA